MNLYLKFKIIVKVSPEEMPSTEYILFCKVCGEPFSVFEGEYPKEAFASHIEGGCDVAGIIIKRRNFYQGEVGRIISDDSEDIVEHLQMVLKSMKEAGYKESPHDIPMKDFEDRLRDFGYKY